MSIWKNLGLVEDDSISKETKSGKTPTTPSKTPANLTTTPTLTVTPTLSGTTDVVSVSEYNEHLQKVFTDRNFPGPLDKMKNLPLDATKYATCFMSLNVAGLTKAHLLDTANKYIGIANEQKAFFEQDLANAEKGEVGTKEQSLLALTEENKNFNIWKN